MKRDMDLVRKILLAIEDQYVDVALPGVKIEGYDFKTVAGHCSILYDGGFLDYYNGEFGGDELQFYFVGGLTWEGHEFLDTIRNDDVWNQTKETIKEKKLPSTIDVIAKIASAITEGITAAVINSNK